ncbi:plasmid replication protein RepC [Cribrihabitans pelagius]|uniref:plasmid replication protein RepC n=1 Tax=Cribrihabitans pelagius TaxID=1765746 RepID=UPI003B590B4B
MAETHDKWALLDALTHAAPDFELNHRTLAVLKALMTFLPARGIAAQPGSAIVFPSNRKLSERLNGMPESTLRRHLAQLARVGIVSRRNSPNRKRYARRAGDGSQLAFGFDLAPLACHAAQVFDTAEAAKARQARLALLRDEVALACQQLSACAPADADELQDLLEATRLLLRRKPCEDALTGAARRLKAELAGLSPADPAPAPRFAAEEMSASGGRNERHIQDSNKPDSDSECASPETAAVVRDAAEKPSVRTPAAAAAAGGGASGRPEKPTGNLARVLKACQEFRSFFPEPVQSWQDADRVAEKVSPMMGIDLPVLSDARAAMGRQAAAAAVLCILERMDTIRSPGAYLRRLAQKARAGQFSITPMLSALVKGQGARLEGAQAV